MMSRTAKRSSPRLSFIDVYACRVTLSAFRLYVVAARSFLGNLTHDLGVVVLFRHEGHGAWISLCISIHPKGIKWGSGLGFVPISQVPPRQTL